MKKLSIFCFLLISSSLFSQTIEDKEYIPMTTPEWSPPSEPSSQESYIVGFDLNQKKEFIIERVKSQESGESLFTDSYDPEMVSSPGGIDEMDNFSDLTLVSNSTVFPYRVNAKIYITFANNVNRAASGVMVSQNVVLTAGHCVYDNSLGGWAKSIKVVPGYYDGIKPYGEIWGTNIYSLPEWRNSSDFGYDIGCILLSQKVGKQTGWYGFGTNIDSYFTSHTFNNPGYPGSPYSGERMYTRNGTYDDVTTNIVYFNKTSYGGMSGAGSYVIDQNNNRHLYAVHSHHNGNQSGQTRITTYKFNFINLVIDEGNHVGIESSNEGENNKFLLYPNPVSDVLNISFVKEYGPFSLSVFDVIGSNVLTLSFTGNQDVIKIPVDRLNPGFYRILFYNCKNVLTKSFVKIVSN
jgi:V8-like Glu-specific endopeptidase